VGVKVFDNWFLYSFKRKWRNNEIWRIPGCLLVYIRRLIMEIPAVMKEMMLSAGDEVSVLQLHSSVT
jgi:hypothetical protein